MFAAFPRESAFRVNEADLFDRWGRLVPAGKLPERRAVEQLFVLFLVITLDLDVTAPKGGQVACADAVFAALSGIPPGLAA